MSFADDLTFDLHTTFYADFNDIASIDGTQVIGYLDKNASQWADIDSSQYVFSTPACATLKRHQALMINGQSYTYVTAKPSGDITHLIVTPRSE